MIDHDRDPRSVLAELFQEELHPDPDWIAESVIERLREAGYVIWPTEAPKPPKAAQAERSWQAGYDAAFAAKAAGKPTPPPGPALDSLSYWSGAVEGKLPRRSVQVVP